VTANAWRRALDRKAFAVPAHHRNWTPYLFILPALALLVVFQLVPIGISIVGSLFSEALLGEQLFVGLSNYVGLLNSSAFWNSLRVTLIFNLLVNPIQIGVAFFMALLVFGDRRGLTFFRSVFFVPIAVSTAMTALLWQMLLDPNIGLANGLFTALGMNPQAFFQSPTQAMPSLIAITTWKGASYWMIFLLAGLHAITADVYEAAEVDGAGPLRKFIHITLPLMKRPLAFVLVADTAINFLLFAPVYLITNGGPLGATDLLMFRAYQSAFVYLDSGAALATSTVILMVIGVVAVLELRLFRVED